MQVQTIILILFITNSAIADIWDPPNIRYIYNTDSTYFVKLYPMTKSKKCIAELYKISEKDHSLIWKKKINNKSNPGKCGLSNDAKYFVTFDNWGTCGNFEDNFMVYNSKGNLLKKYSLEEISPFPMNHYTKSVTSILWGGALVMLENNTIELNFRDKVVNDTMTYKKCIYNLEKLKFENCP